VHRWCTPAAAGNARLGRRISSLSWARGRRFEAIEPVCAETRPVWGRDPTDFRILKMCGPQTGASKARRPAANARSVLPKTARLAA